MAIRHEGEWQCVDPALLPVLNALRDPDGPSGAEPDPEYAIARDAAARLGPLWTVEAGPPPPFDPDVIY